MELISFFMGFGVGIFFTSLMYFILKWAMAEEEQEEDYRSKSNSINGKG